MPEDNRFWAAVIVAEICELAFVPAVIAVVRPLVSPSCMDPPVETVPVLFAVLVPAPVFEAAFPVFEPALLAEFVPVTDPFTALFEPVPFVLFVAFLLAEFVPLAEPLPWLFEPVPDFEPPFFDFEPVFEFISWPACGLLPPCET